MITRSSALPSCLWEKVFPLLKLRSSTAPFNILNPKQLHLENHLFPVSDMRVFLSLFTVFHQHTLMKNTRTMSWVWPSLINNIWCTSVLWVTRCGPKLGWDCKFGTPQIDWFRSDHRRFILKRMKSAISCCISVSPASCKHTVPTTCCAPSNASLEIFVSTSHWQTSASGVVSSFVWSGQELRLEEQKKQPALLSMHLPKEFGESQIYSSYKRDLLPYQLLGTVQTRVWGSDKGTENSVVCYHHHTIKALESAQNTMSRSLSEAPEALKAWVTS